MPIKDRIIKISGGIAILTSAFLLLVVVNKFGTLTDTTKTAFSDLSGEDGSSLQANIAGEAVGDPTLFPDEDVFRGEDGSPGLLGSEKEEGDLVIKGQFDLERPGDWVEVVNQEEQGVAPVVEAVDEVEEVDPQVEVEDSEGGPEVESDSEREGELESEGIKLHYRGIYQEELKIPGQKVLLEVKISFGGKNRWEELEIAKLDTEEGIVYFLLKRELSTGEIFLEDSFTGDYRLIFQEELEG
jgi:hypothetical protein